ncbi:MAG TPA: PASTA domain-containing protein [Gemmatimonadaceae bacterium]|jgi:eukaryotic-like serine/threonine-protein kinase|nr:PASTA domain-containing protein [Gemmatimonadaceae bacterium]
MSVRTSLRGSLPYAVTIIGGFLIAYLIVAFFVFPSGVVPGNAKVPNVTGLQFDDAAKRLAQVGFKAARGDQEYREATPVGTVLVQDPRPGTKEPEGSSVTLTLSTNSGKPQ